MNPYGMTCTMGLQGSVTTPMGWDGYVALAEELASQAIEFDQRHLSGLTDETAAELRHRLAKQEIEIIVSTGPPFEKSLAGLAEAVRLGARVLRMHLTPILEGARAKKGDEWPGIVENVRSDLKALAALASVHGIQIAIENHQDFGSAELLALAAESGDNVGICLDTGNPFSVAEDPISFTQAVASEVIHVHLKDYRAQFTDKGYRLVRCAIGEGAVPFAAIYEILCGAGCVLTATIEPGALQARHIRLLTDEWWTHYPEHSARSLAKCLRGARVNRLDDDAEYRTPWELDRPHDEVAAFELDQVRRSHKNVHSWGWL